MSSSKSIRYCVILEMARRSLEFSSQFNIKRTNLTRNTAYLDGDSAIRDIKFCRNHRERGLIENSWKKYQAFLMVNPAMEEMSFPLNAQSAINVGYGNCVDLCNISLCYLLTHSVLDFTIDFYGGKNFEHFFIVLNNYYDSLSFRSPDNNAIVVDPWINCYFPIEKIAVYWEHVIKVFGWPSIENMDVEKLNSFSSKRNSLLTRSSLINRNKSAIYA